MLNIFFSFILNSYKKFCLNFDSLKIHQIVKELNCNKMDPPPYEKSDASTTPVDTKKPLLETEGSHERSNNQPAQIEGPRQFGFGLWDCFEDIFTFCCAAACPAIVYGQNRQRQLNNEECCLYTGLFCIVESASKCGCILHAMDRQALRDRQHIEGSLLDDLCVSAVCLPCSLTQQKLELDVIDGTRVPNYATRNLE
eukprot:NODE_38_length_35257_cov_0.939047.p22 type:complete len:197 gc:universal NODE_38_length_35257_cov_0.939047:18700-19290(+)